jgi:hypothetical protein
LPHLLVQYSYLQILDFLTTLTFLLYGVQEANPIVQWFLDQTPSPVYGLILVKMIAVVLGIMVWRLGRMRLLARINILFAIVVTWNLLALIVSAIHPA